MQQKNTFLLLALSGSMLMVMLVSTLLFIPQTASLQANITAVSKAKESTIGESQFFGGSFYLRRNPEETLKTIQQYVENNDPDAAKKLYNELYMTHPDILNHTQMEAPEEEPLSDKDN